MKNPLAYIDAFLNSITMYRLVLYGLCLLAILGIIFGFTKTLPLDGVDMLFSLAIILASTTISNYIFGQVFKVPVNAESSYITALILFLILAPATSTAQMVMVALASVAAMASKYVLSLHRRHIFNPAALGAFLIGLSGISFASWWIGSTVMLPIVIIIGLLMARKVRRFALFLSFFIASITSIIIFNAGAFNLAELKDLFTSWPIIFFGTIMLTEPLTTPPHRKLQITYGIVVGILFGIPFHFGPIFNSPELSLLLGNIFSYAISPKKKLLLKLKEKVQMAPLVYEFIFTSTEKMKFTAGQYMEWTLGHKSDTRGNRRYFTIASSPTENEFRLGVKVPAESSSFKKALLAMQPGDELLAGQLSGDFILPKDSSQKIVGIAGGIGITPFRSMAKYISDSKQNTDMVLFYAAADPTEFVYTEIFENHSNIKLVPVLSGAKDVPADWKGKSGYITKEMVTNEVSDYKNRLYYLSGPNVMVNAYKKLLKSLGIKRTQIITDYFPGY